VHTPSWLPLRVALVDGEPAITCADAGSVSFAEPFFDQTIRARKLSSFVTTCDALRSSSEPSFLPAGFIFHMSRCGSTLLSQMLKEIDGVRVYSEPDPINDALLLAPRLSRDALRDLLETIIRAFCSQRIDGPKSVFFKCSSWNVLHYPLFDELFPTVPKLMIVRRPAEVLASIAAAPTGFVADRERFTDIVRQRAGDRTDALDDLEFAAVVLSLFLDAMSAAGTRVLDYSELPSAAWSTIPAFFGIPEDRIDKQRMEVVARFHSKTWPARVPFARDENVDPALERHVANWIGSRYANVVA